MGRNGHLSNDVACNFIRDELDTRTSTLILGHLSAHNNHPEIVRLMAAQALDGRSLFTRLVIAEPKTAHRSTRRVLCLLMPRLTTEK